MDSKYKVWFRVGMEFEFTEEELRRMYNGDVKPLMYKIVAENYTITGDTYAPDNECNEEVYALLGTYEADGYRYAVDEIGFEL